jgi:hypothetical protein
MERQKGMGRFGRALLGALGPVALIAAALSIALNWILIQQVQDTRQQLRQSVDVAMVQLDSFELREIRQEFPIRQTVTVSTTLELRKTLQVPIRTTLPIDTQVQVAVPLLGNINLPIKTTVPVDVQVPIEIREEFPIQAQVPISMTVPVRISLNELGVEGGLDGIRAWLRDLRRSLE